MGLMPLNSTVKGVGHCKEKTLLRRCEYEHKQSFCGGLRGQPDLQSLIGSSGSARCSGGDRCGRRNKRTRACLLIFKLLSLVQRKSVART